MNDDAGRSAFDVPPPDAELRRLEPLLGTWRAAEHSQDSILGPGLPVTSAETFSWLEGGHFLVQTYETRFGDEPAQMGVNYWFYDAEAKKFRIIFFSNNGPFSEEGNRYEGQLDDGTLTFEGPARFQYELDDKGKVKANPDARIERLLANDEAAIVLAGDGPDGLAVLRFRSAIFTERLDAYLEEFYVAPDRRGRGLGRALLEAAMELAREEGARRIELGTNEDDTAARAVYEAAGFSNRDGGPSGPIMFFYEREL